MVFKKSSIMTTTMSLSASIASADKWVLDSSTSAQQIIGVGAWSQENDIAAASANNVGGFMERYDGSGWHDESLGAASAGALMDAATSGEVSVGVSMYPVVISTDNGKTYATSSSIAGISQSASVFPPESGEQIGIVGSFSTGKGEPFVSGVGHSADLGESWTVSAVPGGSVRYGAFPTSDTWYVTAGMWGEDLANPSSTETSSSIKLSSRVMQEKGMFKLLDGLEGNRTTTSSQSRMEDNGWWGKVFKTTDAGETWENVFSSGVDDHYYFNGISCSSADRCVAVAEGHAVDDFRAYVTTDGGASWTNALTNSVKPDDMVSLMGAGWMSDSEGWVAGASKSGRNLVGLFFKTVDGGETFTLEQELDNCYPIDLSSSQTDKVGLAACMSSSGASAAIATLVH